MQPAADLANLETTSARHPSNRRDRWPRQPRHPPVLRAKLVRQREELDRAPRDKQGLDYAREEVCGEDQEERANEQTSRAQQAPLPGAEVFLVLHSVKRVAREEPHGESNRGFHGCASLVVESLAMWAHPPHAAADTR